LDLTGRRSRWAALHDEAQDREPDGVPESAQLLCVAV
jgi:hypothetical protein